PVRRAIKVPTIFNSLGPILSPARPEFQIMGVANPKMGRTIAEGFKELGRGRAIVKHSAGTDEFAVNGPTQVWELRDGDIHEYTATPEAFGVSTHQLSDLTGGDGKENAEPLRRIFDNSAPAAHRDAIAANAGAMFYLTGKADSFKEGTDKALGLLADGTVKDWLQRHEEANYAK